MNAALHNLYDLPSDTTDEQRRAAILSHGGRIISERECRFIDGTSRPQWTVAAGGQTWHFVPNSRAAVERQRAAGRMLPEYFWVRGEVR